MATLTPIQPLRAGVASAAAAVASSDTIPRTAFGPRGALLEIINGNAAQDDITISDAGVTPAGSPLASGTYAASVAAGASKIFLVHPRQATPSTGAVTVTHSVTTTVTYKLYKL